MYELGYMLGFIFSCAVLWVGFFILESIFPSLKTGFWLKCFMALITRGAIKACMYVAFHQDQPPPPEPKPHPVVWSIDTTFPKATAVPTAKKPFKPQPAKKPQPKLAPTLPFETENN